MPYLGTSSWNHPEWRGHFYPSYCAPKDFLPYYAKRYPSVEVNATWYELPDPGTVTKWLKSTPEGFLFALKAPRTITHELCLQGCQDELTRFLNLADAFGTKLGPILFQLPYYICETIHPDVLKRFILDLPRKGFKFAIEIRNLEWFREDLFKTLQHHGIAMVWADYPGIPKTYKITAPFVYIRWIGDHKMFKGKRCDRVILDRTDELLYWKDKVLECLRSGIQVYGYFNNHYSGFAPATLDRFLQMIST